MPGLAIDVRLATEAELEAVTALLVAQLREHRVQTPEAKIASAVQGLLRHPERGRILIAAGEGAIVVDLEVEADHQRAARLYAREGFRSLARTHWVRTLEPVDAPRAPAPAAEITGGCFCGAVRYRVSATTRDVSHCHCRICRRTTGAPFVTWATFPAAAFVFTAGTPAELRATPRAVRQLCAACGTALAFRETARPGSVDVTVGSMDHPDRAVPAAHIWTSSQ